MSGSETGFYWGAQAKKRAFKCAKESMWVTFTCENNAMHVLMSFFATCDGVTITTTWEEVQQVIGHRPQVTAIRTCFFFA